MENNMLSKSGGLSPGLDSEMSSSKFTELLGEVLTADGNAMPLDLAVFKELGIQQLNELQGLDTVDLPANFSSSEQLSVIRNHLLLNTEDQIDNVEIFGNPVVRDALKSTLFNNDVLEQDLYSNRNILNNKLLDTKTSASTVMSHSNLKQDINTVLTHEANALNLSDEIELSQFIKGVTKNNIDTGSEFLANAGRLENNATKLNEQLINIDKSVNPVSALNSHTLKSYSGFDQAGKFLNRIEVPVNQAGWGEALGNRLMMMVSSKVQSANIQLNPAELGPIEIRISVNQEQASVQFVSNNSSVRDAIEDAFPRLKEMFTQNGLNLAGADVSQQSSQQGSQFLNEKNDSSMIDKEMTDSSDIKAENKNSNMLDVGLVDQYV